MLNRPLQALGVSADQAESCRAIKDTPSMAFVEAARGAYTLLALMQAIF